MSFFLGTLILYKSTMEDSCKSCERIVKYIKTKTRLMGYRVGIKLIYSYFTNSQSAIYTIVLKTCGFIDFPLIHSELHPSNYV